MDLRLQAYIASFLNLKDHRKLARVSRFYRQVTYQAASFPLTLDSINTLDSLPVLVKCKVKPRHLDLGYYGKEMGTELMEFLSNQLGNLQTLDLTYLTIDPAVLNTLTTSITDALAVVRMHFSILRDGAGKMFAAKFRDQLTELHIYTLFFAVNEALLTCPWPKLRALRCSFIRLDTQDKSLLAAAAFPELEELTITDIQTSSGVPFPKFAKLKVLRIHCGWAVQTTILQWFRDLPSLTDVTLTNVNAEMWPPIDDDSVRPLPSVKRLSLSLAHKDRKLCPKSVFPNAVVTFL